MTLSMRKAPWTFTASLLGLVPAPNPDECIGQCLLEDATIAVPCPASENAALVVTLRFQRARGAFARHYPIVMSLLGAFRTQIVFCDVGETAQRFLLTRLYEL